MPQNYQFVENLLQLRQHYQSLNEDAERSSNQAYKQLDHINALLVDQLGENQIFVESLIKLRSHYQALHTQHQQKANSTREQLNHVNALLADQAVLQHNQSISIQSATLEQQALAGVSVDTGEGVQRQSPELVQEPESLDGSEQRIILDSSQGQQDRAIAARSKESPQQDQQVAELSKSPQVSEPKIPSKPSQVEQQTEPEPPTESPSVDDSPKRSLLNKPAPSPSSRQAAPLKTPLLPQYQHLSKSEAIEHLLHEHSGTILHVDFIIRALYGELTEEDIIAEKPRMNDSLKKGVAKGLWDRVPDEVGCYTADIKLVDKEVEPKLVDAKKRQPRKPNSKATEGMLPRYLNLTFTEAVESVLRERSGEIVTTDLMARALYGELEGKALTEAKTKVGKTLWSGANQGRWQSVPRQAGAYTLDVSKLR